MSENLTTWLRSDACHAVLLQCADYVIKKARKSSIELGALFHEEIKDKTEVLPQIIAGQLWQFLKTKSGKIVKMAADTLLRNDISSFMTILADRFLDECLDERRTSAVNPAYAYYRHVRHVLSKAEDIRYEPTRQGSFYAYSWSNDLQPLPKKHWGLPYADWPCPAVPFKDIHDKHGILKISSVYWDESLARFLSEHLLPIKELVRFTGNKYPLNCTTNNESDQALPYEGEEAQPVSIDDIRVSDDYNDIFDAIRRQNPRLDCDIIETELETLAQDCLAELTERQKLILHLVEEDATLVEIAQELDEKGPSNIHYHLKKAYKTLKRTWSLWGPPSPEHFSEVEEEEFFIFYDKVIELCKNDIQCR